MKVKVSIYERSDVVQVNIDLDQHNIGTFVVKTSNSNQKKFMNLFLNSIKNKVNMEIVKWDARKSRSRRERYIPK